MKKAKGKIIMAMVVTAAFPLVFVLLILASIFGIDMDSDDVMDGGGCSPVGGVDVSAWETTFMKAGVLKDKGDKIKEVAAKQGIDPILFAAIAFNETGWGTSSAVVEKNNPGGLMDAATGMSTVKVFATLDEGLEAMGVTLHNRIVKDGLNTVEKLGAVYAPIGVANDPNGLNVNWIPTVNGMIQKLGGLSMNCSTTNAGTGQYIIPVDSPIVSSGFVDRINPVTGVAEHHKGIDFAQPILSDIKAADDGVVVFAGMGVSGSGFGGYGNVTLLEHARTKEWTLYGHQSGILVKMGQVVRKGDVIGKVGSTGQSTGPHLHFEIRKEKMSGQIDPAPILGVQAKN